MSNVANESPILQAWESASEWLHGREVRERQIILACTVGVLGLLWFQIFVGPALAKAETQQKKIVSLNADRIALDQDVAKVKGQLQIDPNVRVRKEISRLEGLDSNLNKQVTELSAGWITPAAMADALRQVLAQRGKLKLVSLTSLSPEPLADAKTAGPAAASGDLMQSVYVHGMEVVLSGTYFDVVEYLDALEAIPWQFHWQLLRYEVDEFPNATVTLKVQTYSSERGWIGV